MGARVAQIALREFGKSTTKNTVVAYVETHR